MASLGFLFLTLLIDCLYIFFHSFIKTSSVRPGAAPVNNTAQAFGITKVLPSSRKCKDEPTVINVCIYLLIGFLGYIVKCQFQNRTT